MHQIRQLIGCSYSYTIVKGYEKSRKANLLNKAEVTLGFVRDILNDYTWDNVIDKWFLEGLYASDYAGLLMNKAELAKAEGNQEERKKCLESALKYHNKAAKIGSFSLFRATTLRGGRKGLNFTGFRDKILNRIIEIYYQERENVVHSGTLT